MKKKIVEAIVKYGSAIAAFAFVVVSVAANSACVGPYFEPKEPAELSKFKKFSK